MPVRKSYCFLVIWPLNLIICLALTEQQKRGLGAMARWLIAGQEEGRLGLPQPCPEFRFPKDSDLGLQSCWWQLYEEAKRRSTQRHALQSCQLRISGRCNQSCEEPPQYVAKQLERETIICLICWSHGLALWSTQASSSNITQKRTKPQPLRSSATGQHPPRSSLLPAQYPTVCEMRYVSHPPTHTILLVLQVSPIQKRDLGDFLIK